MVTYSNPGRIEFDAVIQRSDVAGSSAFVPFPGDLKTLFGTSGRVPVVATFDGVTYRGSITAMRGQPLLLVLKETLASLDKQAGDSLHVSVELDTAVRTVDLADDIEAGLREAGQYDAFRRLSYSHQRQFVLWVTEAKRPETRVSRIDKTAEMVAARKNRE